MEPCTRCGNKTAVGHETNYCVVHGRNGRLGDEFIPRHYCCPQNCELDHPEELEASVEFWRALSMERDHDFMFMAEDAEKMLQFIRSTNVGRND
jgi:hypothetical protein